MLPGALVFCAVAASGLELTWSAPPSCPQRDEVEAAVARLLGAGEPRSTPLTVEAAVRRTENGWTVELRTPDGAHRALRGSTCQAVTRASEVVFALMIDPLAPLLPVADAADVATPATPATPPT